MVSISLSAKAICRGYLFIVPHKHNIILRGMICNDHYDQHIKADVQLSSTVVETYWSKVSALFLISPLSKECLETSRMTVSGVQRMRRAEKVALGMMMAMTNEEMAVSLVIADEEMAVSLVIADEEMALSLTMTDDDEMRLGETMTNEEMGLGLTMTNDVEVRLGETMTDYEEVRLDKTMTDVDVRLGEMMADDEEVRLDEMMTDVEVRLGKVMADDEEMRLGKTMRLGMMMTNEEMTQSVIIDEEIEWGSETTDVKVEFGILI